MSTRTLLGPTRVPPSGRARRLALLVVASMALYALFGGLAIAASGPGSPDFLPNSGHQSNPMGATYAINSDAKIFCDGDAVGKLSGTYDLTVDGAAPQGAFLVLYLTPNNGSNADPVGNVEDNEVTIDISGKTTGTYAWSLTITSPFTATAGGILALFATPGTADDWTGGRANSLQCAESEASPSPTPTEAQATPTPSPSPTEAAATPTPTEAGATPTPTEGAATPTLPQSGSEAPAFGTPSPTLPSTATTDAQRGGDGGSPIALLLILLAVGAAGVVLLSPASIRIRK